MLLSKQRPWEYVKPTGVEESIGLQNCGTAKSEIYRPDRQAANLGRNRCYSFEGEFLP